MTSSTPSTSNIPNLLPLDVKFAALKSREDVADMLNVTDRGLRHLLYVVPKSSLYESFNIPKKTGGNRTISAPIPRLKSLQRRLLTVLREVYQAKEYIHGFVQSRGICTNAKPHLRRQYVLNIDLENFFPSINFGRVRGLFLASPYNCTSEVATVLAQICCHENQLPQGAPTSPIISNMICSRLDSHLNRLSAKHNCRYSRYADDITISCGLRVFPSKLASFVEKDGQFKCLLAKPLIKTIENNGFKINNRKLRIQQHNVRQTVTGLVTNKKLNVPREFIRNVRAMLYNWETKGIDACQNDFEWRIVGALRNAKRKKLFKEMLRGKIDYIGTVRGKNDSLYLSFLQRLTNLDASLLSPVARIRLKQSNDHNNFILDNLWVVESTYFDDSDSLQGTGFYVKGIGIITCAHVILPESKIEVYRRDSTEKQLAGIRKMNEDFDLAVLNIRDFPEHSFECSQVAVKSGDPIILTGFPHFGPYNTGIAEPGYIVGNKNDVNGNQRNVITASILTGNSGGPIFNQAWKVVGIAAKGNEKRTKDPDRNVFEMIPVDALKNLE